MEIVSFDISGKFAHFRKFHANNTALSYSIPPRTTIIGMIAAVLGKEKNSYYSELSDENLKISVRVLSNLRKSFHRLNYLMIKGNDDFTGRSGRIQTPFEVITGDNYKGQQVGYRIYVGTETSNEILPDLKKALSEKKEITRYNISLGPANFIGFISAIKEYPDPKKMEIQGEWLEIHSACNSEQVSEIDFPDEPEFKFNFIEEELLPADFIDNYDREVKRMNRVLFSTRNFPLHVKLNGKVYQLKNGAQVENIQFLDYAGVVAQ